MPHVYECFAQTLQALRNTEAAHDAAKTAGDEPERARRAEWCDAHEARLVELARTYLPSGSGFDSGTKFDDEASTPNRLIFHTSFHHMNAYGSYCGWSEHSVIVTPSLPMRFDVRVTGRNKRDIKEFIADTFLHALNETIES